MFDLGTDLVEAPNHGSLVVEGVEDGRQTRHSQEFGQVFRHVEQSQPPAVTVERQVRTDDRAEPHAVHIRHISEIEDDFSNTAGDQLLDGVADLDVAVSGRHLAAQIQKHHIVSPDIVPRYRCFS